jgi:hypothetical protein
MANGPGKSGRQGFAASGKKLPDTGHIPEIQRVITPLTTFGTAVAWEGPRQPSGLFEDD